MVDFLIIAVIMPYLSLLNISINRCFNVILHFQNSINAVTSTIDFTYIYLVTLVFFAT